MSFPRTLFPAWLATAALFSLPAVAGTPSFLCTKATTWIEKTICGSDRLSELDLELAAVYARLLRGTDTGAKRTLESEQRKWWGERAQCQKIADPAVCIEHTYTTRISHLKARPDYPGDVPAAMAPKIIQDSPAVQGWAKNLSEFFKAIKVCAAGPSRPTRSVLSAWMEERGETIAMWLQDDEDQNHLCLAAKNGSKLITLRPGAVDEDLPKAGPVLYLGNAEPRGHCANPVRVLDPTGHEFGWLAQVVC
ncbi:MAG: lysozyme inhibitor LprI family protein [Burkholderiales bacterium]